MKLFVLGLILVGSVFANSNDLTHRPKSFSIPAGKAVFVDFSEAHYSVEYDITNRKVTAEAKIKFYAPEAGFPIFDSVNEPTSISLDGKAVSASQTTTPERETTLRVINQAVQIGNHTLEVSLPITALIDFTAGGVKSAFWTSDLSERVFLERYLPANFEFDQVKMSMDIRFVGNKSKQLVYTNGIVIESNDGSFRIDYPKYYTASSIFFHTVPEGTVNEQRFTLKSIDGRDIPSVVYTGKSIFSSRFQTEKLKTLTTEIFQELERDYGPWPHPSIIVYNAGSGGMEYCGATMTSVSALGHELFHSYFARGVMPANGNSGWLDEALASWRDAGYQTSSSMSGSSRMSARPYYTRTTDAAAYSFGERFMRYLDHKLTEKGGLKPFMRHMVEHRKFSPLFVEEFIKEISAFYSTDLSEDFTKYTYGKKENFSSMKMDSHPAHQKMSFEELKNHL